MVHYTYTTHIVEASHIAPYGKSSVQMKKGMEH
jgi:hypothetical protein